jgi:hypothetical protein
MNRASSHSALLLGIAALCMLVASIGGADFGRYRAWVTVLKTGNIFLMSSNVGSPLGIPVTHWSHGPGLVYVVPVAVIGRIVDHTSASLVAGWLTILVFWWAFLRILEWASRGSVLLIAFGAGAAFLGTHAGFYTRAHASESLALALVAVLVASVVVPDQRLIRASWLVGCSTCLLIVTRSHVALYAVPALLLAGSRILGLSFFDADIGPAEDKRRPERWRKWVAGVALSLPILVALIQQAFVNRWMTGSLGASPYVFGGEGFRSVDWLHPLFWTVITHPWHGLLVYHPLYALAFVALIVCMARANSRGERVLWLGAIVAISVNLWVQAAFYVWWLGTTTFGMRGMATAAVFVVPALVRVMADAAGEGKRERSTALRLWALATLICCLWSLLMLIKGPTQFFSWTAVVAGQTSAAAELLDVSWIASMAVSTVLVAGSWLWARRDRMLTESDRLLVATTGVLCALSMAYLLVSAYPRWNRAVAGLLLPSVTLLVLIVSISLLVRLATSWVGLHVGQPREAGQSSSGFAQLLVSVSISAVFLIGTVLFARLALRTETRLAAGDIPDRTYKYVATYRVDRALVSFREYLRIQGFEERKMALHSFLRSEGVEVGPYPGNRAEPSEQ